MLQEQMKIFSVFGTAPDVIKKLQAFLSENRFSEIKIDRGSNEITAQRKSLLLWKDYIHITVKPAHDNISNIELKVNPLHRSRSSNDEIKEASLQGRLFLYF